MKKKRNRKEKGNKRNQTQEAGPANQPRRPDPPQPAASLTQHPAACLPSSRRPSLPPAQAAPAHGPRAPSSLTGRAHMSAPFPSRLRVAAASSLSPTLRAQLSALPSSSIPFSVPRPSSSSAPLRPLSRLLVDHPDPAGPPASLSAPRLAF